jgi:hypothetical protein
VPMHARANVILVVHSRAVRRQAARRSRGASAFVSSSINPGGRVTVTNRQLFGPRQAAW